MGKTGNRFSGSQKMSAMLSICPAICERIFGGTLFIFLNREDRRYNKLKKMTLANKSAIFREFIQFLVIYVTDFLRCRAQRRVTN